MGCRRGGGRGVYEGRREEVVGGEVGRGSRRGGGRGL